MAVRYQITKTKAMYETQQQANEFEKQYLFSISGWWAEYDIIPNVKVLTFYYKDEFNVKQERKFHISCNENKSQK